MLTKSQRVARENMSEPQKKVSAKETSIFGGFYIELTFSIQYLKRVPGSSISVRGPGRKKVTVRACIVYSYYI